MIKIINDKEMKEHRDDETFIFLAKTKTCSVCAPVQNKLEEILKQNNIIGYYGFIEDLPIFRGSNLIFAAPTIIIFQRGKEMIRESGFINIDNVNNFIKKINN